MKAYYCRTGTFKLLPIVFSVIFVIAVFLQTGLLYRPMMLFMSLLLVIIPFLNNQDRFLNWLTIFYASGHFLYLYALRAAAFLSLSLHDMILLNRLLTILYIVPVYMVCRVFINDFKIRIKPPHVDNRHMFAILGALAGGFLVAAALSESEKWQYILAVALIQAIMQEILWRGLIQQAFLRLLPTTWTFLLLAVACGATQSAIGLPFIYCVLIGAASFLMSVIYKRTGHLLINIAILTVLYSILLSSFPIFMFL